MYIKTNEGLGQATAFRHYSLGDAASSREADKRFKRVAALVTLGLKTARDAIPQLSTVGQRELLSFMTSLLENSFFPRGHGLIDAQGKGLAQSQKAIIRVPVIAANGSPWSFEYSTRLFLSDQIPDREKRGDHMTGNFSSIRLFTRKLHATTPSEAFLVALHEMTHMMFAMIRKFEHWLGTIGAEGAARFLSRQPWRLFVLSGFDAHRERLERHVRDLLRVLPFPMQAAELAASLVEEAFAFILGDIVAEAMARADHARKRKRGPAILASKAFSPEQFVTHYVVERGFNITTAQLKSSAAQQIFQRMTGDVDALAAALRTHLGG